MYKINDKVVHFRDGLATIVDRTILNDNEYFIIRALRGSGETIYVPVKTADMIIREIMDIPVAEKVLEFMKNSSLELTPNTKQRRDSFKRKLSSGSPYDIGFLTKQLYLYENQQELGMIVKFGPADLDMLRFAQNILYDELALTFSIDRETVHNFVNKKIKK